MSHQGDAVPGESSGGSSRDVVLIADPTAEGEALANILRMRGFAVVDTALALLEARVVGETPSVVVVDLDQPGAMETTQRLRELDAGRRAELFCVGDPGRAAELGAMTPVKQAFPRPLDLLALAGEIGSLVQPAPDAHGTTPPPSYALRRETSSPPLLRDSDAPPASDFPNGCDPLDVVSLLPGMDQPGEPPKLLPTELSPELERLLAEAEARVNAASSPHSSSIPSPEEEVDMLLSPELLAALDEPLEPDDEEAGTGSGLGSGTPHPSGGNDGTSHNLGADGEHTSAPAAATSAGTHAGTHGGRTSAGDFGETASDTSLVHRRLLANDVEAARAAGGLAAAPPGEEVSGGATELFDAFAARIAAQSEAAVVAEPDPGEPPVDNAPPPPVGAAKVAPRIQTPEGPRPVVARPPPVVVLPAPEEPELPAVLREGDAVRTVAMAIAGRASGSLALNSEGGPRRIVLHDGDIVTAGSGVPDETLVAYLAARGDLEREVAQRLSSKLPPFGRHAGAALIAYGHLGQDDLWPVLRAHAEWVIGRALVAGEGTAELEVEPPGRLKAEPSVFGGATGAEVFVDTVRRVIPPDVALSRLGGLGCRFEEGTRPALLGECALSPEEEELVRAAKGCSAGELLASFGGPETEAGAAACVLLYALVALDVVSAVVPPPEERSSGPRQPDPLDEEAIRQRVRARMALVQEGDYFALLGVNRSATSYEIKRAYLELRRALEPSRLLTAATADLSEDLQVVLEVLDEAFDILREPHRRERYRRAIEAGPP